MASTLSLTGTSMRERLGQSLLKYNRITEEKLLALFERSTIEQNPLDILLMNEGVLTEAELGQFLTTTYNLKLAEPSKGDYEISLLDVLPDEFMAEKRVMPIQNVNGRLVVGMVDPGDRNVINEITFLTGVRPQLAIVTEAEFRRWWKKIEGQLSIRARGSKRKADELLYNLQKANREQKSSDSNASINLDEMKEMKKAELDDTSNALSMFVRNLLVQAIEQGTSDIHIEPREAQYIVRFRADGILKQVLEIPMSMESAVITRLKVMSGMDISDHRRPQDGRITIAWKDLDYNLRVNTLPVTEGREKMVLRILRPAKNIATFNQLGFSADNQAKLEVLYKAPYGIILVCGPTGSGKSTTLYTIMDRINDEIINISTVEDPVELRMEGLNQSQVNPKADFTFASSMRALLRQDPDVIMVGEIRDYETLEAGIHAALTGHLVFSTIHANSSATTVTRMLEMGASASLISAALNGVIAQRLVRQLCPHCKKARPASDNEKIILMTSSLLPDDLEIYEKKGCELCKHSGYLGRVGLYEIMMVSRDIRQLIAAQANDLELEDMAKLEGMQTLEMAAKEKIALGLTDFKEIERVLGPIFNDYYQFFNEHHDHM